MLKRSILVSGLRLLDLTVCVSINMYFLGNCLCVFVCMCVSDERGFWAVCTYCHFFPMSCLFKDIAADFESQSNKLAQKNSAVLLSVFSFNFVYISTLISSASLSFALPPSLPVPSAVSVSNQTGKIIFHTVALWIWAAQYIPSVTRTLDGMYFHGRFTVISKMAGPTNGQLASVLWITIFGVQDTPTDSHHGVMEQLNSV